MWPVLAPALWFEPLAAAGVAFARPAGLEAFADVANLAQHVAVTCLTEIRRR